MVTTTAVTRSRPSSPKVALAILAGAAVAVFLGVYGSRHEPSGRDTFKVYFDQLPFKVWCTTLVLAFGLVQVLTSLRLYDRISVPKRQPRWLPDVHRLSGTLALLFSVPVAFHCLWSLGFNGGHADTRVLVHSIAGCALYGAYVTKVSFVRMDRLPRAALPIAGGLTFAVLVVIWLTSSLWFLTETPAAGWL
jgi:heme/copper-type cytochrome/quinol oxidase subunit 4